MQVQQAASELQASIFPQIDALVGINIRRVQQAFKTARIGPHHFAGSTGYGHGDFGRAALDEVEPWPLLCLISAYTDIQLPRWALIRRRVSQLSGPHPCHCQVSPACSPFTGVDAALSPGA